MQTCQFSYIGRNTNLPVTALGIERSWDNLKVEFARSGPGVPGAAYYKTISLQGPQIFAILNENQAFYHDNNQWYCYATATDIKIDRMDTTDDIPRATTEEENQSIIDKLSQEENSGLENDD